ncbi:MAG: homoserine dehydrogenase [Elusimicrobia bacterium]|nr:homoserine dehydrogenase [Elusimicrobiota bacterium]
MKRKKIINIGLMGYGTVGQGVARIIQEKNEILSQKTGALLRLKRICDKKFKKTNAAAIYTTEAADIFSDPEIDIFVELIGGYQPAKRMITLALEKGIDVVTANKDVISKDMNEILSLAKRKKRRVYFEAAVGAGIPIIAALNEGLCANRISNITAILNGTTNFILTEMSEKGETFERALQTARKKGFAEADPSKDISGMDSASKLAILASLVFKTHIRPEQIYIRGIENISALDMLFGSELGFVLKLLATMNTDNDGRIFLAIEPAFIRKNHPLASVNGEYNAVYLTGDATGDLMFYGKGAGSLPASSAVVSDIVYTARHILERSAVHIPFFELGGESVEISEISEAADSFYIRFTTIDKPGVLARIARILSSYRISISSVIQKEGSSPKAVPIVMLTHGAKMGDIQKALAEIDALKIIRKKTVFYRILEI